MRTVLWGCSIVDPASGEVHRDKVVTVHDERIESITTVTAAAAPAGSDTTVDLAGRYLLPGLVNMHVHLGLRLPGAAGERLAEETSADLVLRMAANAGATLRAGVTTVRLVSERHGADFALRRAIESGAIAGPRIFTASQGISSTGGHGGGETADGPEAVRRVARRQIAAGADLLKMMASGGIAEVHERHRALPLHEDELRAAVEVARLSGISVTAHAGPSDAIARCLRAGLDGIEHGYAITPALAAEMAERRVLLVPTLSVTRCASYFARIGAPQWMVGRALSSGPRHLESFQHALAAGVRIALGTDMLPAEECDGTSATVRELEHMVEAGMTPQQALAAATTTPAAALGIADEIGTIAPGRRADLVALPGNPLRAIDALRGIDLVMRDGVVHRAPGACRD